MLLCILAIQSQDRECAGCIRSPAEAVIAVTGLGFYSLALLVRSLWNPRVDRLFVPIALAVQWMLLVEMILQEKACIPCLAAAAGSVLLAWVAFPNKPSEALVVAGLVVASALCSVVFRPFLVLEGYLVLRSHGRDQILLAEEYFFDNKISMVVIVDRGCRVCDEFKREYDPKIRSRFGNGISIKYLDFRKAGSGVRKVPTIVIGIAPSKAVTIDGLPSLEFLSTMLARLTRT